MSQKRKIYQTCCECIPHPQTVPVRMIETWQCIHKHHHVGVSLSLSLMCRYASPKKPAHIILNGYDEKERLDKGSPLTKRFVLLSCPSLQRWGFGDGHSAQNIVHFHSHLHCLKEIQFHVHSCSFSHTSVLTATRSHSIVFLSSRVLW